MTVFHKLMRRLAPWLALPAMVFASHVLAAPKAVVVGIDGAQYQRIVALGLPTLTTRLQMQPAYTGGVAGTSTEQATLSGPGWSTILTGTWLNKHGVPSNATKPVSAQFPCLFKRVRAGMPAARISSLVHWTTIHDGICNADLGLIDTVRTGVSDEQVTQTAVDQIRQGQVDFLFMHLDDPDEVGHSYCAGSLYDQALAAADARVGRVLDAVASRAGSGDDWLVLVVTDHGRDANGCNHGAQTELEKSSFIAANKALNAEHTPATSGFANNAFNGLYGRASTASVVPTVLRHLGIEPAPAWLLDGPALLGPLGVRKPMVDTSGGADLTWLTDTANVDPITIQRNGQTVGTVSGQSRWSDPAPLAGVNDYVLLQRQQAASVRGSRGTVFTTTFDWSDSRAYFFSGSQTYSRYNFTLNRVDAGYPAATTESAWPGLAAYLGQVGAMFSESSSVGHVFLRDGRWLRYDKVADRAAAPVAVGANNWPGLAPYAGAIRAAVRWTSTSPRVYFFLEDGRYLRYDLSKAAVDAGYPRAVDNTTWPGLGPYARDLIGAVRRDDTTIHFFLSGSRFVKYSVTNDAALPGYPQPVNPSTWPGLGPVLR